MKNKKLLSLISASLAVVILIGGALAFFTAESNDIVEAKVGSVSVEVTADILHTQLKRDYLAEMEFYNSTNISTFASAPTKPELTPEMFEEAPDNINPGDNDYIEDGGRPGTDHELLINIKNTGSKSIETRVLIEITDKTSNAEASTFDREAIPPIETIFVAFDPLNRLSGVTSLHMFDYDDYLYILDEMNFTPTETKTEENTIVYGIDKYTMSNYVDGYGYMEMMAAADMYSECQAPMDLVKSKMILSGINTGANNAEIEKYVLEVEKETTDTDDGTDAQDQMPETEYKLFDCPSEGSLKLDLGMFIDEYNDGNPLQGRELEITVKVQAMQYRNTSDATWETVFEETFVQYDA